MSVFDVAVRAGQLEAEVARLKRELTQARGECGFAEAAVKTNWRLWQESQAEVARLQAEKQAILDYIKHEELRWSQLAYDFPLRSNWTARSNAAGNLWQDITDGRHIESAERRAGK